MQLKDKVIVITGAAQGLGRAMAEMLAARGARLALLDLERSQNTLSEAVTACQGLTSGLVRSYACDVADEQQVCATFARIAEEFGQIDGLINNAGIVRDGLTLKVKDGVLSKMSLAQWQSVLDVNLTGVFLCTREAAAQMIEHKSGGVIVNISSISRAGNAGQANYTAAKAAVAADTVTWAKELSRYGIRVGAIAPGFIETEMVASMKPEALQRMAEGIPLKRLGQPQEIAHAACFILENDYFTGRVVEVDGGLRL